MAMSQEHERTMNEGKRRRAAPTKLPASLARGGAVGSFVPKRRVVAVDHSKRHTKTTRSTIILKNLDSI
jgi:hypothetical protein